MNKERLKNMALVFLVVMNFVLGGKILVEKKLWPEGYNFFSNMGNFRISELFGSIREYLSDESTYKTKVFYPEKIVINTGDQTTRISLNSADAEFEGIAEESKKLIKKALELDSENVTKTQAEQIYSALSSSSVLVDFPADYSPQLLSKLSGGKNNAIEDDKVKISDVVIVYSPRCEVYFCDWSNNSHYKINLQASVQDLSQLLEECIKNNENSGGAVINYSYDLKFDKPFGAQKATLDPLVLIYSTVSEFSSISAKNPLLYQEEINEEIVNDILRVFNISAGKMSRYTEAGGTLVFVENNAILKLSQNGYLEYQATDGGLMVSKSGDEYANISGVAKIAADIGVAVGSSAGIRVTDGEKRDEGRIYLDYVMSGLGIRLDFDGLSSGVEAEVEDGRLISYKQLVRKYAQTGAKKQLTPFFTALDNVIAQYSGFMNEINIEKMYFGYTDDASIGEKTAEWIVEVDNVIAGE